MIEASQDIIENDPDILPAETVSCDDLTNIEAQFVHEYLTNGCKAQKAYKTIRPNVTMDSAAVMCGRIMSRPHVQEYLANHKAELATKTTLTKSDLVNYASFGLNHAKETLEVGVYFKGIDVTAKLIGAYEQDEDDLTKYQGLIGKIKADTVNVQVNINKNE